MFESDDMKQFFGKCSSAGNSDFKKALEITEIQSFPKEI